MHSEDFCFTEDPSAMRVEVVCPLKHKVGIGEAGGTADVGMLCRSLQAFSKECLPFNLF